MGVLVFLVNVSFAQQNVGIGTLNPSANAVLDLVSPANNQGFLMPRLTTAQRLSIATTASDNGLVVYDTGLNQFYYWNGASWSTFSSQGWGLSGNALTDSTAQFLGSSNAFPWILRTKNTERLRVTGSGLVGIGTNSPTSTLDVKGDINTSKYYKIGSTVILQNQGTGSIYVGQNAGPLSSFLSSNTFVGANTGKNTTGGFNTLVGESAGTALTSGQGNTLLGEYSGIAVTTGIENVMVGSDVGGNASNSDHVTLVGYHADLGSATKRVNATAIGYLAQVDQDNSLVLGGTGSQRVNVGIGTIAPAFSLDITEAGTANAPMIRLNQNNSVLNFIGLRLDRVGSEAWFAGMDATDNDFIIRQGGTNSWVVIDDVTGNVGIGTTPLAKLHVKAGNIRMEDGNQGLGKTLISDANGVASWRQSAIYSYFGNLNVLALSTLSSTFTKVEDVGTFTKQFPETNIELLLTSPIYVENFSGANYITFEFRIDNNPTVFGNALNTFLQTSNSYTPLTIFGMFPKIPAGTHTLSIWAKTNAGVATNIIIDPGGTGGKVVLKELY
jgi:hypothetical protein